MPTGQGLSRGPSHPPGNFLLSALNWSLFGPKSGVYDFFGFFVYTDGFFRESIGVYQSPGGRCIRFLLGFSYTPSLDDFQGFRRKFLSTLMLKPPNLSLRACATTGRAADLRDAATKQKDLIYLKRRQIDRKSRQEASRGEKTTMISARGFQRCYLKRTKPPKAKAKASEAPRPPPQRCISKSGTLGP